MWLQVKYRTHATKNFPDLSAKRYNGRLLSDIMEAEDRTLHKLPTSPLRERLEILERIRWILRFHPSFWLAWSPSKSFPERNSEREAFCSGLNAAIWSLIKSRRGTGCMKTVRLTRRGMRTLGSALLARSNRSSSCTCLGLSMSQRLGRKCGVSKYSIHIEGFQMVYSLDFNLK
jgi:hypothetical protein